MFLFYVFVPGSDANYCIGMFVWLFACTSQKHVQTPPNFLYMWTVAVAHSPFPLMQYITGFVDNTMFVQSG